MTALEGWDNFYIIVGPSAGALIGLQFVVITLIADSQASRRDSVAGGAFTTPSVVHFAVVLWLSAIFSIPWGGMLPLAVAWGLTGLYGIVYVAIVAARMRGQMAYKPVFEDWLYHIVLPTAAYAALVAAAGMFEMHGHISLILVAAAALILLFAGIHNAWDTVIYHVFLQNQDSDETKDNK